MNINVKRGKKMGNVCIKKTEFFLNMERKDKVENTII
jgi:hypothetical protein